jgi:hypothetical protein
MRVRAQEQAQRWQERLDRHRAQQELNQSQNEVRIFGSAAISKGSRTPEASPTRRPLSPARQALKAKMLSQVCFLYRVKRFNLTQTLRGSVL